MPLENLSYISNPKKYNIPAHHVLGHADIAPNRKEDPGVLFPWSILYEKYQVGAWLDRDEIMNDKTIAERYDPVHPLPADINATFLLKRLKDFGYKLPESINLDSFNINDPAQWEAVRPVVNAFRAHFSANCAQTLYDEAALTAEDIFWIWALTEKYQLAT